MTDSQKLNDKTCANAAYNLLETAILAIENAENYVVNDGWIQNDMKDVVDKLCDISNVLWRMM